MSLATTARSGLDFLIAAKRCECADLRHLQQTSLWVETAAQVIHELQRERGLSNLFLASAGHQGNAERHAQSAHVDRAAASLKQAFDTLPDSVGTHHNGARLFSRIAFVLHELDALPWLRQGIERQQWGVDQASQGFTRLIDGLLAVVLEAADMACEPDISRILVALFHWMQAKELAGQERATGTAMFAAGKTSQPAQERLLQLIESQEQAMRLFDSIWPHQEHPHDAVLGQVPCAELERLRRILCTRPPEQALEPTRRTHWFDLCSERMDHMRQSENALCQQLHLLCERQLEQAQRTLESLQSYPTTTSATTSEPDTSPFFEDPGTSRPLTPLTPHGPQDRHLHQLLIDQTARLQQVNQELEATRASLQERKLVERAKGLLMAHRHLSEAQAHRMLRQMAMNQGRRLPEVAETLLSVAEALPPPGH